MSTEPVDTAAISRERVEAYEKALGCNHVEVDGALYCKTHGRLVPRARLVCPVAIGVARVEAAEVDRLTAALDRVRALHRPHANSAGPDDCAECSASAHEWVTWPCKVWVSLDGPPDAEECDHHDEWADRRNRCRHPEHNPGPALDAG